MMDIFECIQKRESCRDYNLDRPVEREKIASCLEAARLAPSACNSQPWRYAVIRNEKTCEKLRPMLQGYGMNGHVKSCPMFIVVEETPAGAMASLGGKLKDQYYALTDIGLSVSQLCLVATAQGLSTCILGMFDEKRIKELLNVPGNHRVRLVVCIGYAKDDKLHAKKRKAMEDISVFWD